MIRYLATQIVRTVAVLLLTCGGALAQQTAASIKLTNVVMELPVGTTWMTVNAGLLCARTQITRTASGGQEPIELPPYIAAFNTELARAGYTVAASKDLFNSESGGAADYQVAARIIDIHVLACTIMERTIGYTLGDTRGEGSMKIEWQIYSPLKKEVVARIITNGSVKLENRTADGMVRLVTEPFASAARELAATPEFRAAISAKAPTTQDVLRSDQQSAIALLGNSKAANRPIADTVGSVVTILTGSGSGSGVLLSDDGYIITDEHVVGEEKEVRVRWSDGIEKVGEVVRVSKTRDVAVIKTDPRGRSPVPIHHGSLTPGQRVYAIGSPTGKEFQGTVSSGVISAMRTTTNGLNYIQSDVMVSHGSSGGALLDESGYLLGLTDLGFTDQGQVAGLNLFTPIGDAMDFLNLEQK